MILHLLVVSVLQLEASSNQSRIYDLRTGAEVPLKELADDLATRDVVFLGEEHGNPAGHRLQLKIIKQLHRRQPDLVLSMEMFERDVQGVLDDYLRGRIDEEQFLAHARPWANYASHYRPMVEFARKQQLDVLAANVPREAAQAVSQGASPLRQHQSYLPRETTAPKDAYWEQFVETMEGHVGTEETEAMERYYQAQCLKDDAMAESITDYIRCRPHRRPLVVHLGGRFHSDYGYGTVWRVLSRQPLLQIAVVSMESVEEGEDFKAEDHRGRSHFLLAVPTHVPAIN